MHHQPTDSPVLQRLDDQAGLERALQESAARPVLIYKHSRTCGTSYYALEELEGWLEKRPDVATFIVDVHTGRAVSRALAEALRVRHESPQVILVRDRKVVWHGSHSAITVDALNRALARATAERPSSDL